jgi:hypothetical protein
MFTKSEILYFTLGFVVVEVVVVEVVVVEVVVVEVVEVVVVVLVLVEVDVVDGLVGIEVSISVDEMVGTVSTGGVFLELDGSGGAVLISGSDACATKVVSSSVCFTSAKTVVGADVAIMLATKII